MSDLFVVSKVPRWNPAAGETQMSIFISAAPAGNPAAMSVTASFREAKRLAGWVREIPADEYYEVRT